MIRLISSRATGKTTQLIRESAIYGATIVTCTSKHADSIYRMAKSMKMEIPKPISMNTFLNQPKHKEGYLIDELEGCLSILGVKGYAITLE